MVKGQHKGNPQDDATEQTEEILKEKELENASDVLDWNGYDGHGNAAIPRMGEGM